MAVNSYLSTATYLQLLIYSYLSYVRVADTGAF